MLHHAMTFPYRVQEILKHLGQPEFPKISMIFTIVFGDFLEYYDVTSGYRSLFHCLLSLSFC